MDLREVELEPATFGLASEQGARVEHLGRPALRLEEGVLHALVDGVELLDGAIDGEIAVPSERCFHGLVWRAAEPDFESFLVRPHQVGKDDAIQYSPNPNFTDAP